MGGIREVPKPQLRPEMARELGAPQRVPTATRLQGADSRRGVAKAGLWPPATHPALEVRLGVTHVAVALGPQPRVGGTGLSPGPSLLKATVDLSEFSLGTTVDPSPMF